MNFDSAFFLAVFLPLLALLYRVIPGNRGKNSLLLVAGLVFYAFGSLQGLVLLVLAALVNFLLGLLILAGKRPKLVCGIAVGLDLAFLAAFKYLDFFLGDILGLPGIKLGLAAPIGISFFVFKCICYVVDTCRDPNKGSRNFFEVLLYISFFPQVMAGPITRFSDFRPQLSQRKVGAAAPGLRRFVIGLAKKLVLSGTLAALADGVFALDSGDLDIRLAWLGAVGYMLQIYFDFSGYSDMAIGLGQVFGFATSENFNYPYIADSITDFWRRWHISLSTWFKDYLYIPLGGNRKGKPRAALNKAIVFTLCGLWHGASWNFVLWGAWHGLLSAVESLKWIKPKKLWGRVYTLLVVCLGFVMFRAATVEQGFAVIGAMFTGFTATPVGTVALHSLLSGQAVFALILGAVLCLPWVRWIQKDQRRYEKMDILSYPACLLLFVLCLVKLAAGGFAPFIYFQF